jgi:uncharacterized protein (DUF983 family)
MKLKCDACGKEYTEEEAGKLKLLEAKSCPTFTILKVFCTCNHVLDIAAWRKSVRVK